jgi:uncharacterized membrane protein
MAMIDKELVDSIAASARGPGWWGWVFCFQFFDDGMGVVLAASASASIVALGAVFVFAKDRKLVHLVHFSANCAVFHF